ncbi:MFS transporter [Pelotomaculum propionicicum]|uniref:MFS transporter n=1 Tax=Pelotomaculum propionicicum TaxID=258475 RepID=UPI003B791A62
MFWINKDYFLLWTGQLVSQLGDKFYAIALAWWVLERTNSPAVMGFFMVVSVLPELLFGLIAGGFIDRWNRKAIIVASDIFRGLAVIVVTILLTMGLLEVWHVFIAAAVISLASAFYNPSVMAVVPQLVESNEIPRANSLSQMIGGLASVAGPVLGAALVGLAGYWPVFAINGLSYLAAALLASFISLAPDLQAGHKASLLEDLKEGFKFISNSRLVFVILIVIGVVHVFYGSLAVAMPFLAKSLAGDGIRNLAYFETAMGAGLILGAVLIGNRKLKSVNTSPLFAAIITFGICFTLLGLARSGGIIISAPYIAIGTAVAVASVYWRSILQVHVPNNLAGRVFSVAAVIADVSLPISFGIFGIALNYFSLAGVMISCGLSLIIISGLFFKVLSVSREACQGDGVVDTLFKLSGY